MPWNNSSKKIIGAANINSNGNGDIQRATGQSYLRLDECIRYGCQRGMVRKWSRIKPIHYPGKFKLSLEDFRGTSDMITAGIVYGLAVPNNYGQPSPAAIHATSWDYVGYPNASGMSGSSPYRFFDFIHPDTTPSVQNLVGYSGNAVPDIYGDIPSTSEFYIGEKSGEASANALYDPNNTEGVQIAEFVVRTSSDEVITPATLKTRLANCYPAIIIGSYVTALTHGDGDIVKPLWYHDAWTSDNWYVDMSKVLGKTVPGGGTANTFPWGVGSQTASLCLVYCPNGGTLIAAGDSGTDIAAYWVYLSSDLAWNASFFPLPEATGKTIQLARRTTDTVANVGQISQTASGFEVSYSFTNSYNQAVSANLHVELWQGNTRIGSPLNRPQSYQTVTGGVSHFESFNWMSDFGIGVMPGDVYEVRATIFTYIGQVETAGNGLTETITI